MLWGIKSFFFDPQDLLIAKSLQSCPTLCDPIDGSPPGFPVTALGFSRQEHWSGLPFPSPMHESEKWKWSHSVVSDPQRLHGLQPSRLLHPWDFPGKSTGVGCHCLLRIHKTYYILFSGCTQPPACLVPLRRKPGSFIPQLDNCFPVSVFLCDKKGDSCVIRSPLTSGSSSWECLQGSWQH